MNLPRIIFAGTPDFSVPCLETLLNQAVDIVGVYTQPDRVAGRGKRQQQSPVKQCAQNAGVNVYQPESFKSTTVRETLSDLNADLMIVVAYGLILPQYILNAPRLGCINIHASLLPRWRGAAPIQRAIEAGDLQTGVCLMQMERGLDTGPVLAKSECNIQPEQTGGQLHDTLSKMGAELLATNLEAILDQRLTPISQSEQGMCYAHKLSKAETRVEWEMDAKDIANKIRAFNPWPVMSSCINGQVIRFHCAQSEDANNTINYAAGEIVDISPDGIRINTGKGHLNITRVQKPGGRVLDVSDFLNGFSLQPGQQFE